MKVVLKNINFLVTAYLWIHCFKIPKCLECSAFSTNMDFYLGHSLPWSAGFFRHLAAKAKNGNAFSCFLQLSSMILCWLFNNNLKEKCNKESWWISKACCDFLLETYTFGHCQLNRVPRPNFSVYKGAQSLLVTHTPFWEGTLILQENDPWGSL